MMLPFVILFFFLVYTFYYKRKADEILEKFNEKRPFTFKNIAIVVITIVVPLIFAIKMTNLAVRIGH
jgi:hypothetical protein